MCNMWAVVFVNQEKCCKNKSNCQTWDCLLTRCHWKWRDCVMFFLTHYVIQTCWGRPKLSHNQSAITGWVNLCASFYLILSFRSLNTILNIYAVTNRDYQTWDLAASWQVVCVTTGVRGSCCMLGQVGGSKHHTVHVCFWTAVSDY